VEQDALGQQRVLVFGVAWGQRAHLLVADQQGRTQRGGYVLGGDGQV
jgi:hypothetical protein